MNETRGTDMKQATSIERMWGGVKVVEAKAPLRVFPLKEDIEGAKRGDPYNCVFSRAVRRTCGAKRAVFLKRTAYVELMQPDGQLVVERFLMPKDMRAIIEEFDRTGVSPEGGFVLSPSPLSETLDRKRYMVRKRNANPRPSLVKGTSRVGTNSPAVEVRVDGVRIVDGVRNGSGLVRFPEKTERDIEVLKARESGMSYRNIAAKFGVSRQRISQICKDDRHDPLGIRGEPIP